MYQPSCYSVTKSCPAFWDLKDCSIPGFLVLHYLPEFAQINVTESLMLCNHLILCRPLLNLLSTCHSIRVFFSESALCIRWPKYWSFSISPSIEYSGLISFRMDWFISMQSKVLLSRVFSNTKFWKHHLWRSAFFMIQLSHLHTTTGKTISLGIWTFVFKVMSFFFFFFTTLSRYGIAFLPTSKHLLILWLQSPSTVILEPSNNKVCHCFYFFHIYLLWSDGTRGHNLGSLNAEFEAIFFILLFHFHPEAL